MANHLKLTASRGTDGREMVLGLCIVVCGGWWTGRNERRSRVVATPYRGDVVCGVFARREACPGYCSLRPTRERDVMSDHTYRVIEIVGSSTEGVDAAIRNALSRAAKTMRRLDWFEMQSVRGALENGTIARFQVTLKVGFRMEDAK